MLVPLTSDLHTMHIASTLVSSFLAFITIPLTSAQTVTTINPSTNWGTWEGWGTSLAWWAKAFGNRNDLADIIFTLNTTALGSQDLPGLGLNIARYNAGASSWNSVNGTTMVVSPDIIPSRQMDAYWTDWYSEDPTSSSWNWTTDANQRAMLQKAAARGANKLELFSNSPVWWMCTNHNPSGNNDGADDNLQTWNVDQHGMYLATIAQYAKKNWGIEFVSVEAFNEPVSDWWVGTTGTQEGCHFDISYQSEVIPTLRGALNSAGLVGTIVSSSDENTYDLATATFQNLTSAAVGDLGRVNVHGYQYGNGRRDLLYDVVSAAGKDLWNSEYGESDATGGSLARNLILDLRWLHPTGWVYWQALDESGWGLIEGDNDNLTVGAAAQKYFILAQFTRHIRPGMMILDGGSDYTVAAYDSSSEVLVIVVVNWGNAGYLNFELSRFSQPSTNGTLVPRWSSQIGTGEQYEYYEDTHMNGTQFWSWFANGTIQTFEVPNVRL